MKAFPSPCTHLSKLLTRYENVSLTAPGAIKNGGSVMSKKDNSPSIEKHDSKLNIFQRMIEVQKLVQSVDKNETVKMSETDKGYKAVTHDDVAAALHLPLAQCGVFMLPDIESFETTQFDKVNRYGSPVTWYRTDIKILVKWVNVDNPEDFITSRGAAFALDTSDKSFAKAYSLALKIVLLKVHLLESRDGEEQRPFDEQNAQQKQKNNQNQNQQSQPPKAKDEQRENKPQAPGDVIYPFESSIKGKKIGDVDSETLQKASAWLKGELAKDPKPKNVKQIAFIYAQVKAVLIDRNPPPPDDIPENINATTGEFLPEDESQKSPDVENESQDTGAKAPDPSDYVLPKIEGLDLGDLPGKRLGQISEKELRLVVRTLDAEMKKGPKSGLSTAVGFEIRNQITTFFKSMDMSL